MTALPDKPWLIDGRTGRAVTYAELLANLNRRPAGLRALCQPATTMDALQAITLALAVAGQLTLFDSNFSEAELTVLGYGKTELNVVEPIEVNAPIDLAALQALAAGGSFARLGLFTSGSTGRPKLVWQSAANLTRAVKISLRHAAAVWAFAYNPTHVAGIQVYLQALANGCTLVDVYGLDRVGVMAALGLHRVTHISATPSFYRLLLPADRPLPGVRSVTLGGESVDARLVARLRDLFPNARFHNVYASTEAGTLLMADGDAFTIAPGLEGRVVVRGGGIHLHRSLLGEFSSSGQTTEEGGRKTGGRGQLAANEEWYDTGDMVEMVSDAPLRFRIVARECDWVNVGGSKVNPREVEAVLEDFPGVRAARITARANSVMGHMLIAEVELAKPDDVRGRTSEDGSDWPQKGAISHKKDTDVSLRPTEQELRSWLAERLQPFKVPRLIRFVHHIAHTRTGKVSRQ